MKLLRVIITNCIFLFSVSCYTQNNNLRNNSDLLLDTQNIQPYKDTIFFDLNGDERKDFLLRYVHKYKVAVPKGETSQILSIFIDSNRVYKFKTVNNFILWTTHNRIEQNDGKTFVVINEGSGQDWNRYYCYFQYDNQQDNWFLTRYDVFKYDNADRILVKTKQFSKSERKVFHETKFYDLFQEFLEAIPDPPYYEKIKTLRAMIYNNPSKKSKMYLVRGDEVKIINEDGEFFKFIYYGKKTIKGWIKKSDIE